MANAGFNIDITGLQGFEKTLQKFSGFQIDKKLQGTMMRKAAPTARAMRNIVGEHTGTLKARIKNKRGKQKKDVIDVWTGVQESRFKKAPHWHLVAFGTRLRKIDSYRTKASTKKRMRKTKSGNGINVSFPGGDVRLVTNTGKMPAKPYAEIALRQTGKSTGRQMASAINDDTSADFRKWLRQYQKIKGRA
jgi:hypothetical protein